MTRTPIFSAQFEQVHGRPMDFFLKGGQKHSFGKQNHFTSNPEEDDAFINESYSPRVAPKLIDFRNKNWEEVHSKPADPVEPLRAYREDPVNTLTGDPLSVARNIMALDTELRNGRVNDKTLYRGAARAPHEDAQNNNPVSFSENRHVAGHFAKRNRGEIFQIGHNEVRGIRMEDYGVLPKTVGPSSLSEDEWLIDPNSLRGKA